MNKSNHRNRIMNFYGGENKAKREHNIALADKGKLSSKDQNSGDEVVIYSIRNSQSYIPGFYGGVRVYKNESSGTPIMHCYVCDEKSFNQYSLGFSKLDNGFYFINHINSNLDGCSASVLECIINNEKGFQGRKLSEGGSVFSFREDATHPVIRQLVSMLNHVVQFPRYTVESGAMNIKTLDRRFFLSHPNGAISDLSKNYLILPKKR